MSIEKALVLRSGASCELCGSEQHLSVYEIPANFDSTINQAIYTCSTCLGQINEEAPMDVHHWRCLNDSMWSAEAPVQAMSWRMLSRLAFQGESWADDALDMLYLDEELLTWAKSTGEGMEKILHKDCNGTVLENGDNVVVIKDLVVKGANFTAKRGTAVRKISLVSDNPEHLEGKVEGQRIVLLTKYVKKS